MELWTIDTEMEEIFIFCPDVTDRKNQEVETYVRRLYPLPDETDRFFTKPVIYVNGLAGTKDKKLMPIYIMSYTRMIVNQIFPSEIDLDSARLRLFWELRHVKMYYNE